MKPCPFSGSTDLREDGGVIVCDENGVTGPKPAEGQTAEEAWDQRFDGDAEEPEVTEEEKAEAEDDKSATAATAALKTLPEAKAEFRKKAVRAGNLHATVKRLRATNAALRTGAATARQEAADAVANLSVAQATAKAAEGERDKATKALADHKVGEPRRINDAITAHVGHGAAAPVPPAGGSIDNPKPANSSDLTGKARVAAHIEKSGLFSK